MKDSHLQRAPVAFLFCDARRFVWEKMKKSLIASHWMSWRFSCVHFSPKTPSAKCDLKSQIKKVTLCCKFSRFHDFINVSILINSHLTHILHCSYTSSDEYGRILLQYILKLPLKIKCAPTNHTHPHTLSLSPHTISSAFHFPLDPANVSVPLFYPSLHPVPLIISGVQGDGCEPLLNSRPAHITPASLTVNEKHWMYFIHTPPHERKGDRKTCRINVCVRSHSILSGLCGIHK